jgi:hypothetical protein
VPNASFSIAARPRFSAEAAARSHGLRLSAPAKDYLLTKSAKVLSELEEKGELKSRRAEIERNTAALIDHIVQNAKYGSIVNEITYGDLAAGLSLFCRLFPHSIPFCMKAE